MITRVTQLKIYLGPFLFSPSLPPSHPLTIIIIISIIIILKAYQRGQGGPFGPGLNFKGAPGSNDF
jgi:hypothetical protein